MSWEGVPEALARLADAAKQHFEAVDKARDIKLMEPLKANLSWRPHLRFSASDHLIITAEAGEAPYPEILKIRAAELLQLTDPIAVYSICPVEAIGTRQGHADKNRLRSDGFGLLVVDVDGAVTVEFRAFPLIQHISAHQFDEQLMAFTESSQKKLRKAYQMYCDEPINGVRELSELVEGVVHNAVVKAQAKKWVPSGTDKNLAAKQLDALHESKQLAGARGQIGGARNYISTYRNPAHHYPRSKTATAAKYRSVRLAFLNGLVILRDFQRAMRNAGIAVGF